MLRCDTLLIRCGAAAELRKSPFTGFLAILWLSMVTAPAQPRLAIIPEDTSLAGVVDILAAQFTRQNKVTLLERDEIQKVYHEQELSAGNTDYLKLGHVLGADGLLLLRTSTEGTNEFLSTRLVAVKPGVVLTAEKFLWPIANLEDWSAAFAPHLDRLLPKLTVLEKDAVPISIINLRSAMSSPSGLEAERQLKLLTLDRLGREKELFVLERQRMELLSEENQLKGLDDSTFWSGSYLLDGVIDRDGYSEDKMTVSARLTPPHGGAPIAIEAAAKRGDLTHLIDELAKKVVAALSLKSTLPAWNAADEAEEFFSEGNWALRWGLYAEAQAASESGWVLGKRSRDLAILRIWAYARDIDAINEGMGNITIPGYPDPEKLPTAIRAADLFCAEATSGLTNSSGVDGEMFSQGIYVFRSAAALLDGFYTTAELRNGNEDQLTELRRLARQVEHILDPEIELARANRRWPNRYNELNKYEETKWEQGCVLFDKPEDSLVLFQQMLESEGFVPESASEPVRIVGWSWSDRKRVPEVRRRFIAEASASTNDRLCLEGHLLSMVKVPFHPEATFHDAERTLLDTLWNHRNWILSDADHTAILGQAEEVLRRKYEQVDVYRPFQEEPFNGFRQNLRKAYLSSRTNFNPQIVDALFNWRNAPIYSTEQARELVPLMDGMPKTNWLIANACDRVRQTAGLPLQNVKPAPAKPIVPPEKPIVARFINWNGDAFSATPNSTLEIQRIILRDGRLWVEIQPVERQQLMPSGSGTIYAAIDPKSGACETIPFPKNLGPYPIFDVTADSLYVSVQDHIERYRRREKRWEPIPCTLNGGAEVTEFHGKLYLSTSDSVLEVDPDSGAVQILASARRKPAANDIDSLIADGGHEFFRVDEQLFLGTGDRVFLFTPTNHAWRPLPQLSFKTSPLDRRYYFQAGVVIFAAGMGSWSDRIIGAWFDVPSPQLLLESYFFSRSRRADQLGRPCWDWPEPFRLDYPSIIVEGKSFWMLHPRRILMQTRAPEEPIVFRDDRHATLLHFEPGTRQATTVPIRFERDGQPIDPFDRSHVLFKMSKMFDPLAPFWTDSPDGFVVCCYNLMGHWFIPRSEIEKRLTPLKFESTATGGAQP